LLAKNRLLGDEENSSIKETVDKEHRDSGGESRKQVDYQGEEECVGK
jgi:hypothetical protein